MSVHLQQIGTSWYFAKGAVLDTQGKRKAKKHCLGTDYQAAQKKAAALEMAWQIEAAIDPASGLKVWSTGRIEEAIAFAVGSATTPVANETITVSVAKPQTALPPETYTLRSALDEFKTTHQARLDCSEAWREAIVDRITGVCRHIPELLDRPLADICQEQLDTIRTRLLARPANAHTGRPLAIATVKEYLYAISIAFAHFEKYRHKFKWTPANSDWQATFALTRQQSRAISSLEERSAAHTPKAIYTIQEVSHLYRWATPMVKRYILMGILFGWRQQDIADFRKDELLVKDGEHFIERNRGKTGVLARWWVPPEVAELLLAAVKKTPANPDNRAFLTQAEKPLCHGGTDSIALVWVNLLNHQSAKFPRYPFGSLRRLAGQMMQDSSGSHELAQMVLSHKRNTVADTHYVSGFAQSGVGTNQSDRLTEEQKKLWTAIRPLFFGASVVIGTTTVLVAQQ